MPDLVSLDTPAYSENTTTALYQCNRCKKSFGRIDHLHRHARTHTQERPYGCDICGKSFSRSDILKRHAESHSTGQPTETRMKRPNNGPRRRISQACRHCVASKLKCTEKRPCDRCVQKTILCDEAESVNYRRASEGHADPAVQETEPNNNAVAQSSTATDQLTGSWNGVMQITQLESGNAIPFANQGELSFQSAPAQPLDYDPSGPAEQFLHESNIISDNDATFSSFLRELLLHSDAQHPVDDVYRQDGGVPGLMQGFDIAVDYNFDDWNLYAFDSSDGQSLQGAAESIISPHGSHAYLHSHEDATITAGAKAFKKSIWNWIPVSEDNAMTNQADLKRPTEEHDTQRKKMRLSKRQRLDHGIRDRILAMILEACDPATTPKFVSSFPSNAFLERNLWVFLQTQSQSWDSWIHLPTFETRKTHHAFIAASFAAGATCAQNEDIQKFGYALHEVLRVAIGYVWEKDNRTTRDLVVLQSYAINLQIGLWSGDKRKMEISESFYQPLITMLRRAARFHRSRFKLIRPSDQDEGEVLEDIWMAWVQQESWKRLVYHVFVQNSQSSMTRLAVPLISYAELTLPLPEPQELWFAKTAAEWKELCLQQDNSEPKSMSLAEAIKNMLEGTLSQYFSTEAALGLLVLFGMWGLIFEYRQSHSIFQDHDSSGRNPALLLPARHQALVRALNDFKLSCTNHLHSDAEDKDLGQNHRNHYIERSVVLEYLLMALHVPISDIEILAGKYGDHEARIVWSSLYEWAKSRGARQGIWHAGQVFSAASSLPSFQMRDFLAVAVYHASLSMWAYGVINGSMKWLEEQNSIQDRSETGPKRVLGEGRNPTRGDNHPTATSSGLTFAWLTDATESPELQRWLSLQAGIAAVRIVNGPHHTISARLDNPEEVMAVATRILRGSATLPSPSSTIYLKSPMVNNIAQLVTELGTAARGIKSM